MAEEKDARFQFRLPSRLLEEAQRKAALEDLSLAQVLRRLLRDWINESGEATPESD